MTTRLRIGALTLFLSLLALASVFVDAARRARTSDREVARAIVSIVGTPDLALSSNARWLRHPSQVEPWAAIADNPSTLDTEPAGAVIGPPRETSRRRK